MGRTSGAFSFGLELDPSAHSGGLFYVDGRHGSRTGEVDEQDLVEFTRGEQQTRRLTSKLSRKEKGELTTRVLTTGGQATFAQRIGQLLRQVQPQLPTVQVEYRGLTIQTDALVGSAGTPSLLNSALRVVRLATLQGGLRTAPLTVLDGVSGVLLPGRLTLLLGPPGSGKTVFLRALAGRLQYGKHLRMTGSIKYNGRDAREFEVHRTVGLVEQHDAHLPDLSVAETVKFAGRCQNSASSQEGFVKDLAIAIANLSKVKRRRLASMRNPRGMPTEAASAAGNVGDGQPHESPGNGSAPPAEPGPSAGSGQGGGGGFGEGGRGPEEVVIECGAAPAAAIVAVLPPEEFEPEFAEAYREIVANRLGPQMVLKIMGLAHAADTLVGDEMHRGISGGERKRLTTAEIIVGPQTCVLMDEISTGLDSATAYAVVKTFRDVAHGLERTFVISLLQPAPEVVALFDDLLLLTDGVVIYHGPVECALPYFQEQLGFACPVRKDHASFLQEITTPAGQLAYATPSLLGRLGLAPSERDPAAILAAPPTQLLVPLGAMRDQFWLRSSWGVKMLCQLEQEPFDPDTGPPGALYHDHFANGLGYLTRLVVLRQVVLNLRMKSFYMARVIQTVIMGLIIGSLFATIDPTVADGRNAIAVLVLSTIFLSMMSSPQIAFVFMTKRCFYKQRDNKMFPSFAYVMAQLITQMPQSTIEAVVFSLLVYWISGLTREATRFFVYLLLTWSSSNCLAGLFRLIGSVMPSMVVGNSVAMLILLLMMVTNGFSLVATDIPPYIVWIYWINPLSWAIRAMVINELTAPRWSYEVAPGLTAGEAILLPLGFKSSWGWVWGAVGFLWGSLAVYTAAAALALDWTHPPAPQPAVSAEETKEELTRQVLTRLQRAKRAAARLGSTLTFRGGARSPTAVPATEKPRAPAAADDPAAPQPSPQAFSKLRGGAPGAPASSLSALPAVASSADASAPGAAAVPFTPITLVCRNIRYYVPDPAKGKGEAPGVVQDSEDREISGKLELLKGLSFFAQPGSLTALMGGSGAGKTTLMDVVLGRKTVGVVRGDILVNGYPKEQGSWSRVCGYVEQQDVHSGRTTVREALVFSARLRLEESVTMEKVSELVDQTLALVELNSLENRIVGEGDSAAGGLSGEQRKRLSIAVELVANPAVMFMDEPTSGLDARAAAIVIRAVRAVSRSGRTVAVTIHQPSMEIFESFDQLLLLQIGGRLTYFGQLGYESQALIDYLQAVPGVDTIRPGSNPATWMLEVTGGSMTTLYTSASADFPAIYAASELCHRNLDTAALLVAAGLAAHTPLAVAHTYATSAATQRAWLLRKWFLMYWRMPSYNFVRLIMTLVIGLIYGVTYRTRGALPSDGSLADIGTVQNIMGLIFSQAIFLGMFNAMTVQAVIAAERAVFYRERAASMYAPGPYSLATGLAELPYLALQSIIMVNCTYWLVEFQAVAWKYFYFLLLYFLSLLTYTLFGQFLVHLTPNQLLAQLCAAGFNQLWAIFCGFLIPYTQMGKGWKWMNRISPTTWIIYGLSESQLGDQSTPMVLPNGQVTTVANFMSEYFGYDMGFIWFCPLIVFGYAAAFRVGSVLLLRYVSYLRR